MDLMFLADKADQEASKEAGRLQDMQRAPSHSDEALFDSRVGQRRVWMAKNELALQVMVCLRIWRLVSDSLVPRILALDLVGRASKAPA